MGHSAAMKKSATARASFHSRAVCVRPAASSRSKSQAGAFALSPARPTCFAEFPARLCASLICVVREITRARSADCADAFIVVCSPSPKKAHGVQALTVENGSDKTKLELHAFLSRDHDTHHVALIARLQRRRQNATRLGDQGAPPVLCVEMIICPAP